MSAEFDYTRISSKFIRDEFNWDFMGDVKFDLLRNNLEACERILKNPEKFPKANFKFVEMKAFEIQLFLLEHGRMCCEHLEVQPK